MLKSQSGARKFFVSVMHEMLRRLRPRAYAMGAVARITSCGGVVAVSYPGGRHELPIIPGVNNAQVLDPDARVHVRLPVLMPEQLLQLRPYLKALLAKEERIWSLPKTGCRNLSQLS